MFHSVWYLGFSIDAPDPTKIGGAAQVLTTNVINIRSAAKVLDLLYTRVDDIVFVPRF